MTGPDSINDATEGYLPVLVFSKGRSLVELLGALRIAGDGMIGYTHDITAL